MDLAWRAGNQARPVTTLRFFVHIYPPINLANAELIWSFRRTTPIGGRQCERRIRRDHRHLTNFPNCQIVTWTYGGQIITR